VTVATEALRTAERKASFKASEQRRAKRKDVKPNPDGMELRIGDCRKVLADVVDNSVAAIITDPPYMAKALPLYEWLAAFAQRVLIPGGSLILFTGQSTVGRDIVLCEAAGLRYWWHLVKLHTSSQRLPGVFVLCEHKPVLWFVKGTRRDRSMFF
jgi:hypothetical protein